MSRHTIEWRAPRTKGWRALSVSALAPFSAQQLEAYRQSIAETLTHLRGVAIMPAMVRIRPVCDGVAGAELSR
jgi:hypothetical protein